MSGKTSGLAATIIIDDGAGTPRTISNDVNSFTISTPVAVQDTTGVDKYAMERLLLLRDSSVSFTGTFNSADANMSHAVFLSIPSSSSPSRTTKVEPTSGSTPFISMELLLTDYQIGRAATGELTWTVPGVLADGTIPAWS